MKEASLTKCSSELQVKAPCLPMRFGSHHVVVTPGAEHPKHLDTRTKQPLVGAFGEKLENVYCRCFRCVRCCRCFRRKNWRADLDFQLSCNSPHLFAIARVIELVPGRLSVMGHTSWTTLLVVGMMLLVAAYDLTEVP